MITINDNLNLYMHAANLTERQLAAKSKNTTERIHDLLHTGSTPTREEVAAIAHALQIPESMLWRGVSVMSKTDSTTSVESTANAAQQTSVDHTEAHTEHTEDINKITDFYDQQSVPVQQHLSAFLLEILRKASDMTLEQMAQNVFNVNAKKLSNIKYVANRFYTEQFKIAVTFYYDLQIPSKSDLSKRLSDTANEFIPLYNLKQYKAATGSTWRGISKMCGYTDIQFVTNLVTRKHLTPSFITNFCTVTRIPQQTFCADTLTKMQINKYLQQNGSEEKSKSTQMKPAKPQRQESVATSTNVQPVAAPVAPAEPQTVAITQPVQSAERIQKMYRHLSDASKYKIDLYIEQLFFEELA